ncbi:MAG: twin-arginine translocase subunit TatC [Bacteroidales bacterium]
MLWKKLQRDKARIGNANDGEDGDMTFLEHIEVLRWHVVRSAIAVVVGAIVAFILRDVLFSKVIFAPSSPDFITNRMFGYLAEVTGNEYLRINTEQVKFNSLAMSGQFMTHVTVSLIAGFVVALPYVVYEVWRFLKPALHENELKYASSAVFFTSILFFMGVLFAYFVILPLSIDFLVSYTLSEEMVKNTIDIKSYISTMTTLCVAGGVSFLLPIFVYFFTKVGLVTPTFLRKYRRHAIVVLLIVSAIITPPDLWSQLLVCIPLMILYEISIFISKGIVRKQELNADEQA